jgi:hypothetical protein
MTREHISKEMNALFSQFGALSEKYKQDGRFPVFIRSQNSLTGWM